ncbi:MAG: YHS domain-containing (seleno)protein [Paracoccaceae bacterium]|nr:YHS domain-containing (seleno)protein [Paracoccaceae bacterium]MDG1737415.1 YHS domain-containing (seleno)protein [Paracoccaceae bacterium]MDG2260317.1 YHS domain-containing (seleno)protein [Paracoccaceae bacterium]
MHLNRRTMLAGLTVTAFLKPSLALARESEIFQTNGIAINGSDAVAYFTTGKPDSVFNSHSASWHGVEWHFDSAENATQFQADPTKYAPIFGGYCAYAASLGYLATTVPEAWTIYEGKLYLNASLRARELWLRDVPGNIAKATKNWPGILG